MRGLKNKYRDKKNNFVEIIKTIKFDKENLKKKIQKFKIQLNRIIRKRAEFSKDFFDKTQDRKRRFFETNFSNILSKIYRSYEKNDLNLHENRFEKRFARNRHIFEKLSNYNLSFFNHFKKLKKFSKFKDYYEIFEK